MGGLFPSFSPNILYDQWHQLPERNVVCINYCIATWDVTYKIWVPLTNGTEHKLKWKRQFTNHFIWAHCLQTRPCSMHKLVTSSTAKTASPRAVPTLSKHLQSYILTQSRHNTVGSVSTDCVVHSYYVSCPTAPERSNLTWYNRDCKSTLVWVYKAKRCCDRQLEWSGKVQK